MGGPSFLVDEVKKSILKYATGQATGHSTGQSWLSDEDPEW